MTKKVIFVGGSAFSGSTFFHMTLANDPAGFATGEVYNLFHPTRERHLRKYYTCNCGDPACTFWDRVEKRGKKHLYETIFDLNPEVEFIVDSSKNIIWLEEHTNYLIDQGIEVYHLIIWKTLLEYGHSLRKRNSLRGGKTLVGWATYHRSYYSFIDDWRSVQYANYTQDQMAVLQATCDHLNIPFFEGKENFWEKTHHTLGGNLTARIHLHDKDSSGYQDVKQRGATARSSMKYAETNYRKLYYEDPDHQELQSYIQELLEKQPYVGQIEEMLLAHDVTNGQSPDSEWPELQLNSLEMSLRRVKQHGQAQIRGMQINYKNRQVERDEKTGAVVPAE